MTGGEVAERQTHGLMLFDAEGPPPGLLGPRLPAAPMRRRCVTPELELLGWPGSLGAAVPRGGHHP
jgi:hypothetical protein